MSSEENELRSEYPTELIKSGVRGKYAKRCRSEGTNLVRIDPDLRRLFPDSAAVNRALRDYVERQEQ
jgi:hypothetical protein